MTTIDSRHPGRGLRSVSFSLTCCSGLGDDEASVTTRHRVEGTVPASGTQPSWQKPSEMPPAPANRSMNVRPVQGPQCRRTLPRVLAQLVDGHERVFVTVRPPPRSGSGPSQGAIQDPKCELHDTARLTPDQQRHLCGDIQSGGSDQACAL